MPLTRAVQYDNYTSTVLAAPVLAADNSIEVLDPSILPSVGSGEWFYLVLRKVNTEIKEIVRATNVLGQIVSVNRGVDDTTAADFSIGDPVEVWVVKIIFDDIRADFNNCLAGVEADIAATDVVIANNQTKIGEIETQNKINAGSAELNTDAIAGLGEDITDLIFSDMTDVTLAGSGAFLASQGSGASAANPMIKVSDIPVNAIGITHYRERLTHSDFTFAGNYSASTTVTGLVDGDYILMGTWAYAEDDNAFLQPFLSSFQVTINTPAPVNKVWNDQQDGPTIGEHIYRQYMVPFTISGSTSVTVDFLIIRNPDSTQFNIRLVDLFAVRVA